MSAWHYNVLLLPLNGILQVHDKVPAVIRVPRIPHDEHGRIDMDRLNDPSDQMPDYWTDFPEDQLGNLVSQLASWIPETKSWSSDARMFGDDTTDRLSIWNWETGGIHRIKIEFCLSNPAPGNLERLLRFPQLSGLLFLGIQSERLYSPTKLNWLNDAQESSAIRYLRGQDYFDNNSENV